MLTLLTAGCSFTKDNYQLTWADYISSNLGYTLINVAGRGAGIDFISKRTMYQCLQSKPTLAVIMLPSIDRFDWYIDTNHPLVNSALSIASWQDGKTPGFVKIDGTLSEKEGYTLTGGQPRGDKKHYYKFYYNESSALINYWSTVYNLENFFKIKKIPYYFTMAYNKDHLVEQNSNILGHYNQHQFLLDTIDWSRFIFYKKNQGFLSFVKDNNYKIINHHPETLAHADWVNHIMLPYIK
jgi:hypothetical protein